ncbi:hypothetical protein BZA70DRAFT_279422 [Myxozyma melibiosi]|uniref:HECT-type E3 ubiquitin transferase n=1 Tax=Myxozyma melibiosi TaxID=54550 RepID=A0ABR1F5X3_9ASCO
MPANSSAKKPTAHSSGSHGRGHSFPASITQAITRQLHSSSKKDSNIASGGSTSGSGSNNAANNINGAAGESYDGHGGFQRPESIIKSEKRAINDVRQGGREPVALTTGHCMCCLSSLRYPVSVPCFRCTVCQTTNDVSPLPLKPHFVIDSDFLQTLRDTDLEDEENFRQFQERLASAFQSAQALNKSFSSGKQFSYSETGLDYSQIALFYRIVLASPSPEPMRLVLKYSENLLKRPGRILTSASDLRFLLIILENPVLYSHRSPISASAHHSAILKRICGLFGSLNATCHHYLVNWFARLTVTSFRAKVELINSFTSHRLSKYCSSKNGGAKIERYGSDWKIRAAARILSLFFAANIQVSKIPTSSFYNTMVDYIDITHDFDKWEKQGILPLSAPPGKLAPPTGLGTSSSPVNSPIAMALAGNPVKRQGSVRTAGDSPVGGQAGAVIPPIFTFCQYPFYLSMGSKITILEYDARRQMEIKAREAFFSTLNYKRVVQPHLVLKVRRECIIDDSLRQISNNEMELKKGLKIEFVGEDGVDAGGLRKEWFLLLVREMFDPMNGMFIYDEESNYCWFNHSTFETADQYFLVGVVLGLAMYNSTILDIQLPPALFKKLLGCQCTMADLMILKPTLAKGLQQLLEFEGNVEEVFCRDFVADHEVYGQIVQVPLVSGGERKPVTNANRQDFVNRYIQFIFDTSIDRQFQPFKRGFYHVIGGNALTLFRPEEIELLVRGSDEGMDVDALRAIAIYDGWSPNSNQKMSNSEVEANEPVVGWFWDFFATMNLPEQRKLLTFVTGSDRIPATGIANLIFKISKLGEDSDRFPISHTCFNQLCLYRYSSREKLEEKLRRAIVESEGFGLR